MSKALKLEEEELSELDEKYGKQFSEDFAEENEFWIASQAQEVNQQSATKDSDSADRPDSLDQKDDPAFKKIHRALARATHPDLKELQDDTDFKDVQEAYESGDVSALILKAFDLSIEVDLDESELFELEKKIENQKISMNEIKQTMKWAWAASDKSSIVRRKIQVALGIDPKKFEAWKKSKES